MVVAGDLNLADKAPRLLEADPSVDPLVIVKDWRASKDPILSPLFSDMTEIETPDPTHFNKALGTLNTIDRVFLSFPGWVCNQLFISGQVSQFPEVLLSKGLSDHAPLVVSIAGSPMIPSGERPIPKQVFRQPEYAEYLEKVWALGSGEELSPPAIAVPGEDHEGGR